jgi:hypothetical protein
VSIRAGVVSVALMGAVIALLEMAAENSSPTDLDCGQNAALRHRKRSATFLTMGFAIVANTSATSSLGRSISRS